MLARRPPLSVPSLAQTDCPLSAAAETMWCLVKNSPQRLQAFPGTVTAKVFPAEILQEFPFLFLSLLAPQALKAPTPPQLYLFLVADLKEALRHARH